MVKTLHCYIGQVKPVRFSYGFPIENDGFLWLSHGFPMVVPWSSGGGWRRGQRRPWERVGQAHALSAYADVADATLAAHGRVPWSGAGSWGVGRS